MTVKEIINDASYDDVKDGFYNLINATECFFDFVGYLEDNGCAEYVREYMTQKMLKDCSKEDIKEEFNF